LASKAGAHRFDRPGRAWQTGAGVADGTKRRGTKGPGVG